MIEGILPTLITKGLKAIGKSGSQISTVDQAMFGCMVKPLGLMGSRQGFGIVSLWIEAATGMFLSKR